MARPSFVTVQTLLTVARLGTFTAAAQALNTTQSAISARMRELERTLDFDLFIRQGRKLHLTIAAEHLIARVEPLIHALEDAFEDPEVAVSPRGRLKIGMAEAAVSTFNRLLPQLHKEFPRLQFTLEAGLSTSILHDLDLGILDIAIVAVRPVSEELRFSTLGETAFGWVCSDSLLRDGQGNHRSPAELFQEELIWFAPNNSPYHNLARNELVARGVPQEHLCTARTGLLEIALAGGGVVVLPDTMSRPFVADGRLRRIDDALGSHRMPLFLAVHGRQSQRIILAVETALIELAKSAFPVPD